MLNVKATSHKTISKNYAKSQTFYWYTSKNFLTKGGFSGTIGI